MNKQIIIEQCEKVEDLVNEATHNEEVARTDAEKYQGIKENNTILLGILNVAKNVYQELERTLRIIEIDKEYENTNDELENLKIKVNDLIDELQENVDKLKIYDIVTDTVKFYKDFIKEASGVANRKSDTDEIDFSFDSADDDQVFDINSFTDEIKEEEKDENDKAIDDETIDFSSLYGNDNAEVNEESEDTSSDLQKVIDVADFSDKIKLPEEPNEERADMVKDDSITFDNAENSNNDNDEDSDDSISELNDLFNYLNNDDSFSA